MSEVKICGLRDEDSLQAAIDGGTKYIGLNFVGSSPRYIAPSHAALLIKQFRVYAQFVALFADESIKKIAAVIEEIQPDMIQLHGSETPEQVAFIRSQFGLPVIKAMALKTASDLEDLPPYMAVADMLLLDAPHGGSGESFDWNLLQGFACPIPWGLAGGLTAENVGIAISMLHPDFVDVASGVEEVRGVKSPAKIKAFLEAVKAA